MRSSPVARRVVSYRVARRCVVVRLATAGRCHSRSWGRLPGALCMFGCCIVSHWHRTAAPANGRPTESCCVGKVACLLAPVERACDRAPEAILRARIGEGGKPVGHCCTAIWGANDRRVGLRRGGGRKAAVDRGCGGYLGDVDYTESAICHRRAGAEILLFSADARAPRASQARKTNLARGLGGCSVAAGTRDACRHHRLGATARGARRRAPWRRELRALMRAPSRLHTTAAHLQLGPSVIPPA